MKHRTLIVIVAFVCSTCSISLSRIAHLVRGANPPRAHTAVQSRSEPLFVLIEYDPWLMVIGSDSPAFALYDDGTIIYRKTEGRSGKYLSTKLKSEELADFLDGINQRAFESLANRFEPARGITDQPEYLMILKKKDETYKVVSVYGRIEPPETRANSKALPEALVATFHYINGYDNPQAHEWLPDFVEVMIWPYEYAPDKNLEWPKEWPGLKDSRTEQRGDSYSLFIEKSRFDELKTFLAKRRERQAVQIDGKKWAISIRFPFPKEEVWTRIKSNRNY